MTAKKQNGGKTPDDGEWEDVPDRPDGRDWHPDQEDEEHRLIGALRAAKEVDTKYGRKFVYAIMLTEECLDSDGPIDKGEAVTVWGSAGLAGLSACNVGDLVQITPAGWGGKGDRKRCYTLRVKRRTPERTPSASRADARPVRAEDTTEDNLPF